MQDLGKIKSSHIEKLQQKLVVPFQQSQLVFIDQLMVIYNELYQELKTLQESLNHLSQFSDNFINTQLANLSLDYNEQGEIDSRNGYYLQTFFDKQQKMWQKVTLDVLNIKNQVKSINTYYKEEKSQLQSLQFIEEIDSLSQTQFVIPSNSPELISPALVYSAGNNKLISFGENIQKLLQIKASTDKSLVYQI